MKRILTLATLLLLTISVFAQTTDAKKERAASEAYKAIVALINAGKPQTGNASVYLAGSGGMQKRLGSCTCVMANDHITVSPTITGFTLPEEKGSVSGFTIISSKSPFYLKGTWQVEGQEAGEFTIRILGCQEVSVNLKGKGKQYSQIFRIDSTVPVAAAIETAKDKIDKLDGVVANAQDFMVLSDPTENANFEEYCYFEGDSAPEGITCFASRAYLGLMDERGRSVIPLSRRYSVIRYHFFDEQYCILFTRDNKQGVSFLDESECISNIYEGLEIASHYDGLLWGKTSRGVELIQLTGDKAQRAVSISTFSCSDCRAIVNIGCCVKVKGKWGVLDLNGRLIVDPVYDEPLEYVDYDGFIAKKDGKYGYLNKDFSNILPFEYDLIYYRWASDAWGFCLTFKGTYDGVDEDGSLLNAQGLWGTIYKRNIYEGRVIRPCVLPSMDAAEEAAYEEFQKEMDPDYVPERALVSQPTFMGNDLQYFATWVNSHLEYPDIARENGISGKVTIEFTIDYDGSVVDVRIKRGVDESLDKEAIRVVKSSPKWIPGYYEDGNPAKLTYTFPVYFQLK